MDEREARMHAGLTQLAEPMAEVPDLDQVVARGRQLRQRRRMAGIAGGTAAVLVAAAGLGLVLTSSIFANNGRVSVVATPSPAPSTAARQIGVGATEEAHIALPPLGLTSGVYDVRFRATKTATGIDLKVTAVSPSGNFSTEQLNQDRNPAGFDLEEGLRVGLLTDRASWFTPVDNKGQSGLVSYTAELPDFGVTVFVVAPQDGAKLNSLAALAWRGSDGQLRSVETSGGPRDSVTADMPSARFVVDGHAGTLASLEHNDLLALVDYDGLGYAMNVREAQGNCRFAGSSTKEVGQDEVWQSLAICPLPIGATQITPILAPGVSDWKLVTVGDRPVVVVPYGKGTLAQIVTGLRYTTGAGKQVETKVG